MAAAAGLCGREGWSRCRWVVAIFIASQHKRFPFSFESRRVLVTSGCRKYKRTQVLLRCVLLLCRKCGPASVGWQRAPVGHGAADPPRGRLDGDLRAMGGGCGAWRSGNFRRCFRLYR